MQHHTASQQQNLKSLGSKLVQVMETPTNKCFSQVMLMKKAKADSEEKRIYFLNHCESEMCGKPHTF